MDALRPYPKIHGGLLCLRIIQSIFPRQGARNRLIDPVVNLLFERQSPGGCYDGGSNGQTTWWLSMLRIGKESS